MPSRTLRFGFAVFAGGGVQAGVGEAESFYRVAAEHVRFDDLVDVGFGDVSVPNSVGVDDEVGAVFALVEASGLVGADFALQSALGQFLFEELLQLGFGGGVAASAGMSRRALVSADENVSFEFGHQGETLSGVMVSNKIVFGVGSILTAIATKDTKVHEGNLLRVAILLGDTLR